MKFFWSFPFIQQMHSAFEHPPEPTGPVPVLAVPDPTPTRLTLGTDKLLGSCIRQGQTRVWQLAPGQVRVADDSVGVGVHNLSGSEQVHSPLA